MKKAHILIVIIVLGSILAGCQNSWQTNLSTDGEISGSITSEEVRFYIDELKSDDESILLAQVLYHHGYTLIDHISLFEKDKLVFSDAWQRIAEEVSINRKGEISIHGQVFSPSVLDLRPSQKLSEINMSIIDLAPTTAYVLGLPPLPEAQGQVQYQGQAAYAALILVDGLQYQKLKELISRHELPFFSGISQIYPGLTVYPSITTASTAALLTGAKPQVNGVYGYGYRSTDMKTLFDLASEHNLSVTAVEGYSLSFNLRNANVILSGDRDGDGFTDDNVLANSLEIIQTDMPDLLFVHLHDVDDMGHTFGPDSAEYETAIIRVDSYLSQIYDALPTNTFITIFADHGMQSDMNSTGGNHGQLTHSAMIIPIIFMEK